jgi:hypothetical protein
MADRLLLGERALLLGWKTVRKSVPRPFTSRYQPVYNYGMSDTELLIKEISALPADCITEVLDFVAYLKQKQSEKNTLDIGCPFDHTPNAVTIAAIQEGDAMLKGEIPANRYRSLDEILEALRSDNA